MIKLLRKTIRYKKERFIVNADNLPEVPFDYCDTACTQFPSFPNSGLQNIMSTNKRRSSFHVTHIKNNSANDLFKNPVPEYSNVKNTKIEKLNNISMDERPTHNIRVN